MSKTNERSQAKKFLAEKSPAYMTARTALRELRTLTDSIPKPILPPRPVFNDQDRSLVSGWKAYLKWEEENHLVINDQDVLADRISYALRKCLGEMRHFPELWWVEHHIAGRIHWLIIAGTTLRCITPRMVTRIMRLKSSRRASSPVPDREYNGTFRSRFTNNADFLAQMPPHVCPGRCPGGAAGECLLS